MHEKFLSNAFMSTLNENKYIYIWSISATAVMKKLRLSDSNSDNEVNLLNNTTQCKI